MVSFTLDATDLILIAVFTTAITTYLMTSIYNTKQLSKMYKLSLERR